MDILAVPAGSISSGSVPVTNVTGMGAGVQTALQQAATGTGSPVLSTSPTLTTPNLGTPSTLHLLNADGLPISTGISGMGTGVATALTQAPTGTGSLVLSTGPAIDLSNATGLPVSSVSGVGTGVTTALGANVTGTGGIVLQTSPTLITPALGTPSSGTLTNCTGLPVAGVSGLGTGVATALGQAVTGSGGIVEKTSPTITTPTLSNPTISGTIQSINGISTAGNGVAIEVAVVNFTNQTASLSNPTLLYNVPSGQGGRYRVTMNSIVMTPASTSSTLPNITVAWTDADSGGTPNANIGSSSSGNTTSAVSLGTVTVYAKGGTAINVFSATAYASNPANAMAYNARFQIDYLGA